MVLNQGLTNEAVVGKRVQLIKVLVPGLSRIAILRNPSIEVHAIFWRETEQSPMKWLPG